MVTHRLNSSSNGTNSRAVSTLRRQRAKPTTRYIKTALGSIADDSFTKIGILSPTVARDTPPNRTLNRNLRVSPVTHPVCILMTSQQTGIFLRRAGVKRRLNCTRTTPSSGGGGFVMATRPSLPTVDRDTCQNRTLRRGLYSVQMNRPGTPVEETECRLPPRPTQSLCSLLEAGGSASKLLRSTVRAS